jgi:hypothetical protein
MNSPRYTEFQMSHDREIIDHPYPNSPQALKMPHRVPGMPNSRRRSPAPVFPAGARPVPGSTRSGFAA